MTTAMASKQLGKLRQWAGEVILSNRDKSTVTDEFASLETDVELRRAGLSRLSTASETYYYHVLTKKKDTEPPESLLAAVAVSVDAKDSVKASVVKPIVKQLPIETLGLVMCTHGEQFGEDSAFGTSLVRLGKAHVQLASLQSTFANDFRTQWLAACHRFGEDIRDFEHQKKKLESRRLSYSAAMAKHDKSINNKKEKEKDRKEAEEELQTARLRYEETSEDVRTRARLIQDNEIQQLRSLTELLNVEIKHARESLSVLEECKVGWYDETTLERVEIPRMNGPAHKFSRSVESTKSKIAMKSELPDSSDDEESASARPSVGRSLSRATSRGSRKRKDSGGAVSTLSVADKDRDKEKDKERVEREKSVTAGAGGRGMGVGDIAGWASNAMNSVTGRIVGGTTSAVKTKPDKDNFAALSDDESAGIATGIAPGSAGADTVKPKKTPRPNSMHARTSSFSVSKAADAVTGIFTSSSTTAQSHRTREQSGSRSPQRRAVQQDYNGGTYTSDVDEEGGLFGDHNIISHRSPMGAYFDTGGADSAVETDDDRDETRKGWMEGTSKNTSTTGTLTPGKRPVPPPPPPRRVTRLEPMLSPPIPARRPRAESASSRSQDTHSMGSHSQSKNVSPFESSADLDLPEPGCGSFRQNPFLPKGMCSNCQQFHV